MMRLYVVLASFILFLYSGLTINATGIWGSVCVFDELGNRQYGEDLEISIGFLEESEYQLSAYGNLKLWRELDEGIKSSVCSNAEEKEYFTIFELKYANVDKIEEIGTFKVTLNSMITDGSSKRSELMGTGYRVYYLNDGYLEQIEIKQSDKDFVSFETDKPGMYVLYYNPNIYDVKFYEKYPEGSMEPFYVDENLGKTDIVEFPETPQKDGYVFTGWKQETWTGAYTKYFFLESSEITAFDLWKVYASWCQEDDYTPLKVTIDSEKAIKKGKEDGAEITLTLSEGKFDEVIDENVENNWEIVGSDELTVASVERIDDITAKLTLSGNSSNKYTSAEIKVQFTSDLYISYEYDGLEMHEIADIQLDENGIKKAMFISDNSITLEKQKKSGSGGGTEKHTITFEANGGEEVQSVRVTNGHCFLAPEAPLREGYVFKGWYTDEELTKMYDFEAPVKEDFTLYAAWEKPAEKEQDVEQIILTIKIIEEVIEFVKSIIK